MDAGAPIDGATQSFCLDVGELRGPVTAETAAYHRNAVAVNILASLEVIECRRKGPLRARFLAEARIFAGSGHINGKSRESFFVQQLAIGPAIFLPAIDSAPVHDERRTNGSLRNLQIADDFLSFERNLDALEWRI